jgi:hypothetical protein
VSGSISKRNFYLYENAEKFKKLYSIFLPTEDVIDRVKELQRGQPIRDAVEGWCPVEGCEQVPVQ